MADTLLLLVGAVLVNNFVLVQFLGLCPFVGVSRRLPDALAMGLATSFVMACAAAVCHLLDRYVLQPRDLGVFSIVVFVFVIAALVQFVERMLRATSPLLHEVLGLYLPLITTNCAVLGLVLLVQRDGLSLADTLVFAVGAAAGFTLVMALFAALRERLAEHRIPAPFRGAPVVLVTAGILALAFMGFQGVGG
jgi:electron transport complex protein RnfA